MSNDSQIINKIQVDNTFFSFIEDEVCNGLNISAKDFFKSLSEVLYELQKKNTALLEKRDLLQSKIDQW
jgi:malate synthase